MLHNLNNIIILSPHPDKWEDLLICKIFVLLFLGELPGESLLIQSILFI